MENTRMGGKIALITGSSRGIGRAIAERLHKDGARIAINYSRDEKAALGLKERLSGSEIFKADISNRNEVRDMIKEINKKMGRIDILVNNAGIFNLMPFEEYDEERVERMYAVNVKGAIYTALETLDNLKKSRGIILNIASNAGVGTAADNTTFYSMTKAAIIILTKRLSFELGKYKIRVNAIAPGWVESDMTIGGKTREEIGTFEKFFMERTELNMIGKPEYIANIASFLCSDEAAFIDGQVIVADGGRIDNLTHSL
ncbi:MAG: SDR family oxidoreductase [Candidatus Thermoplasmatota archaeon]|nr:SDR family oxidoreductase [Candidatus Thermoplasmatota archaeon]